MTLEEYENSIMFFVNGYSKYFDITDDPGFKSLLPEINLRNPEFMIAYHNYQNSKKLMNTILKSIVKGDGE